MLLFFFFFFTYISSFYFSWGTVFMFISEVIYSIPQGGLATAFDLAAFRLFMIAPVKKSVNHPKNCSEHARNGLGKQQVRLNSFFAAIRQCEVKLLLVPLVIGFFVLFLGNVELTFSFLLVLRLSL